ncbi:MAG TPA: sigma-70 family RNA polymerase sigma factor [Thermoanaerobaculia bacterium]|nr:sigma-70 family RNA polymerase sigma factor [Thermoanaerobaculia bacterium]
MASPGGGGDGRSKRPGTPVAVEDAYRRLADLLRYIAETKFNIPPGDAEGVVNEVFTSYLLRRDLVRDTRKWLIGAVCHASRSYWRDAARTCQMPENVCDYVDPASPGLEGRIVDRVTMARALTAVGPKCRETLRLYYAEGYSAAEIAAHLGTTSGYVMQMLHTARKRVRKAYDALKAQKHQDRKR